MTDASWKLLVETIAQNGDLVARLYVEHRPDNNGRCRVCTISGTNGIHRAWPCTLADLSREARELIRRRGSGCNVP